MKTKHTPGPWLVRYNSVTTALNLKIVDAEEQPVCEFADPLYANERNGIKSERESIANANLIAAAPELLATLQALVAHGVCRILSSEDAHQLEQLIAKAKGE